MVTCIEICESYDTVSSPQNQDGSRICQCIKDLQHSFDNYFYAFRAINTLYLKEKLFNKIVPIWQKSSI